MSTEITPQGARGKKMFRCSTHAMYGAGVKCPKCATLQARIKALSRDDLIKVLLSHQPTESEVDAVLEPEVDIDELLLIFANMADEPCESDKSFREFVRKNSQVAYNKRKRATDY
jgi:hypothetical protein